MVPATISLGAQHLYNQNYLAWFQYNVTGWNIMPCVWGMIFQWAATLKMSTELPATSRHCLDVTENLLKEMLNPIKQKQNKVDIWHTSFLARNFIGPDKKKFQNMGIALITHIMQLLEANSFL